jgi:hypothetical protein
MPLDPSSGGTQKYLVRDPQGNVYGPADADMLRDWVREGRIVPGMHVAPRETREWVEVTVHPELAGALALRAAELGMGVQDLPTGEALGSAPAASSPPPPAPPADAPPGESPAVPALAPDVLDAEIVPPTTEPPAEPVVELSPLTQWLPDADTPADTPPADISLPAQPGPAEQPLATPEPFPAPVPASSVPAAPLPVAEPPRPVPLPSPPGPPAPYPAWSPGLTPAAPAYPHDLTYARPPRNNVLGILSLTFGALAVPMTCGCGCFVLIPVFGSLAALMAITAIVLGSISLAQIKANPAAFRGKGMAVAGVSLGVTVLMLGILGILLTIFSHFSPGGWP